MMTNSSTMPGLRDLLRPALVQWETRVKNFATDDILTDVVSVLEPLIAAVTELLRLLDDETPPNSRLLLDAQVRVEDLIYSTA